MLLYLVYILCMRHGGGGGGGGLLLNSHLVATILHGGSDGEYLSSTPRTIRLFKTRLMASLETSF